MRFRHQPAAGALGFVAALAMGAVGFPRPATARPPISEGAAARAEGTRLFRAKNFAAACPKFEKAAQLAPADPEPLADLALCRQRLGDTSSAEKVNRQVIDLGSTGKALTDPRFARSRRHAYFNLRQINSQRRYFPEVGRDICGELNPEEGCAKKLFYCADSWTGGGSWMTQDYRRVNIAASAEAARFDEDDSDPYARDHSAPDFDELTQPFQPTPEVVEDEESVTYFESYSDKVNEWRCDEKVWSCDRSDAVAADAKKCLASAAKAPTSRGGLSQRRLQPRQPPAVARRHQRAQGRRQGPAQLPRERPGARIGIWLRDRLRQRLHWPRRPDLCSGRRFGKKGSGCASRNTCSCRRPGPDTRSSDGVGSSGARQTHRQVRLEVDGAGASRRSPLKATLDHAGPPAAEAWPIRSRFDEEILLNDARHESPQRFANVACVVSVVVDVQRYLRVVTVVERGRDGQRESTVGYRCVGHPKSPTNPTGNHDADAATFVRVELTADDLQVQPRFQTTSRYADT